MVLNVRGPLCVLLLAAASAYSGEPPQAQDVEAHARKAQEFLKANRPDLAAGEYAAIVALKPDDVDAQGNLGVLLFFQGDYAKAAPHLHTALRLAPKLVKIRALLGMAEKRIGQPAEARSNLEAAFPDLKEDQLRKQAGLELIELYSGAGDLDKAAATTGELRRSLPADIDVLYAAHRIHADLADETMLRVAMLAPESARMRQLMAHELARQGNRDGAIRQLREALKIDPKTPGLHFELAEIYRLDTAATAEAEQAYRAALAVNPFDAKSECRLGEMALRGSDPKQALKRYSRAVELQPDDAEAVVGLAKTLLLLEHPDKARIYFERAARLDPLDAVTHYRLAGIYRGQGRAAEAERELAEFRRLRKLKERLMEIYKEMHVQPAKPEQAEADVPR